MSKFDEMCEGLKSAHHLHGILKIEILAAETVLKFSKKRDGTPMRGKKKVVEQWEESLKLMRLRLPHTEKVVQTFESLIETEYGKTKAELAELLKDVTVH